MIRGEIEDRLHAAGIANAAAEARWLTEHVSGYEAGESLAIERSSPTPRQAAALDALVTRRRGGEPLQYVLGSSPFRGVDLMLDPRVLIPRPESEWVAELAARRLRAIGRDAPVIVDLGTGSGAIALSLAKDFPPAVVHATDVSVGALDVARANGAGNAVPNVQFHRGDWFDALPAALRGRIDLLVSNPPYVAERERADLAPEIVDYEPQTALFAGVDGLDAIRTILRGALGWLAPGGIVVVEHAPDQAAAVVELATTAGLAGAESLPDLTGRPRALLASRAPEPDEVV
jgi:release factor glutamine methyltransferase